MSAPKHNTFMYSSMFSVAFFGVDRSRSFVTNTPWVLGVSVTLEWCKQADDFFLDLMGKFLFPSWDFFQHLNF